MKLDIKHIINYPGSEGGHWLADAVEAGDGGDKTRENAARERQQVPDQITDTEAASGSVEAGKAPAAMPEMPGPDETAVSDDNIYNEAVYSDGHGSVPDSVAEYAENEEHDSYAAQNEKAPDSPMQASGEGGNSQLQEAYEVLHRLQALDDALKNTEREADTPDAPEAYDVPADDGDQEPPRSHDPQVFYEGPEDPVPEQHGDGGGRGKYVWLAAIAAAFIVLLAVTYIYTAMIPRDVNATINDEPVAITTKAHTVGQLLEEQGIDYCDDDYISVPLTTYVSEGLTFELKHAVDFKVTADGKTKNCRTLYETVGEALSDCGVKVGKLDIVEPSVDTLMSDGLDIVVKRVRIEKKTVVEKVAFKTVTKEDSSLDQGKTKVVKKGRKGKAKITYRIKYIDGKVASKKKISKKIIRKPVNKVVAEGTRFVFDGSSYSRKLTVKAYAYTGGGRTAMGTQARVGEIAVDPSVIPLGTTVYIEGVGERRAEDTGGNIKGNTIDIYMNSEAECRSWGVRYITIYIK